MSRGKWWSAGSGLVELRLTRDQWESCSGQGRQDDNVAELRRVPSVRKQLDALDPARVAAELREYGAWDAEQLANHDDNLDRLLWIACCDLREESRA